MPHLSRAEITKRGPQRRRRASIGSGHRSVVRDPVLPDGNCTSIGATCPMPQQPNILLMTTDEERFNLPGAPGYFLPGRERIRRRGIEFDNYDTASAQCSSARSVTAALIEDLGSDGRHVTRVCLRVPEGAPWAPERGQLSRPFDSPPEDVPVLGTVGRARQLGLAERGLACRLQLVSVPSCGECRPERRTGREGRCDAATDREQCEDC